MHSGRPIAVSSKAHSTLNADRNLYFGTISSTAKSLAQEKNQERIAIRKAMRS